VFRDAGDINGFEECSLGRFEGDVKRISLSEPAYKEAPPVSIA